VENTAVLVAWHSRIVLQYLLYSSFNTQRNERHVSRPLPVPFA
jgi:hypothetical protein